MRVKKQCGFSFVANLREPIQEECCFSCGFCCIANDRCPKADLDARGQGEKAYVESYFSWSVLGAGPHDTVTAEKM
jgi:hypothetical protein